MKLIGKRIEKDGSGRVTVRPEDDEDMWHLYNIIQEGDRVRAAGMRRIQNVSTTGSVDSKRIRLNLTLAVTRVTWSPSSAPGAESGTKSGAPNAAPVATAKVEVTGRVAEENQHVKLGAFHTLDIEANKDVRIEKDAGGWDSVALGRVEESCVPGRGAEVAAIVCGEGSAIFCLLSEHMTTVLQRLEVPIPRKISTQSSAHEKGLSRYYQTLYTSFLRHVPYASPSLRAIVIASPGWTRDAVFDSIMAEASRTSNKALLAARNKFIKVHVNSPHVHSLVEALKSPEIASQMKETKFAREGMMLDKFFKMLATDEMRAWYGPDHVALAADRGAIGTLLISDELFRSSDAATRKKYVNIVEDVQQKGGKVLIFSSMHESGRQLNQLTGIAAILTFPLDIEVVEAEEREAKEEEERRNAEERGTET
ncbi:pelota [Dichomitus squalens]|uniref:Pelota n=2 Tax=Dichomitus squalens TaxID=114155 RepID=A0A4Q9Q9S8_9APHY|nr:pelota [Dichomitus squalens LYAD-421 SS1]EJF61173.1 pelota [Dichomitus squalens LYAD-421 SS1]TBU49429.1 pelota [Dichomitus squalens]TBU63970.1 pelota [Dichomitus squalens]